MTKSFSFYLYSMHKAERLVFSSGDETFMSELSVLINRLPIVEGGNITALLCNTEVLRKELSSFETTYEQKIPRVRRIMAFVKNLGEGEYFFYLDDTAPLINHICCMNEVQVLPDFNKKIEVHDSVLRRFGLIFYSFESYGFGFNGIKAVVGNHQKHPCRFCGRDNSETSYKKVAHAIPDALGNDLLFCDEECDECNARLAPIEDNLTNFLDFNRVAVGIKTKKGEIPEVEGDNFVIRRSGEGYRIYAKGSQSIEEFMRDGLRLNHRKIITNLGIYKALVKMVIDLTPTDKLPHFKETIRWINGDVISRNMPSVYWCYAQPTRQPSLFLFFNEQNMPNTPYCTAAVYVCNMLYLYVVPFIDIDKGQYKHDENLKSHWPQFLRTFTGEWHQWDLSDDTPATPFLDVIASPETQLSSPAGEDAPSLGDVFEIHHRPTKSVFVDFPELDTETLFSKHPTCERITFCQENHPLEPLLPHTELSYSMGCNILIYFDEGRCETWNHVGISDTTATIKYVTMQWKCSFFFCDIASNIKLEKESFSFDYKLRDILWHLSLYLAENEFQSDLDNTEFENTKLTFMYDEHHNQFIHYIIMKDGIPILECDDKQLHR